MTIDLKTVITKPLTNMDLSHYLGNDALENILKYSELDDYNDLELLLPTHKSYKIILIEYERNSGHWICIMRYGKTIEIFNSFGVKHSNSDFAGSRAYNKYLGQFHLFLDKLARDEAKEHKFDVIYNKLQFQKKSVSVNTCGRHVVNRIICMLHYDMTLSQYQDFMKDAVKKTDMNYDEIVSTIISN